MMPLDKAPVSINSKEAGMVFAYGEIIIEQSHLMIERLFYVVKRRFLRVHKTLQWVKLIGRCQHNVQWTGGYAPRF